MGKCGGVYGVDMKNYYIRWRYEEDIIAESPVAVYQDKLYVLFDNGDIHAIDPQKGQQIGILKTDRELSGSVRNANFSSRGLVTNEEILIATFNDRGVWAFCQSPCFEEKIQGE